MDHSRQHDSEDVNEKAKLAGLYTRRWWKSWVAEISLCAGAACRLNPGAHFAAGEEIKVPNVLNAQHEGAAADEPSAGVAGKRVPTTGARGQRESLHAGLVRVVVSKRTASLTVYSARGRIIFWAQVTTGSTHDSLPLGTWRVTSVTRNPTFHYDPELFWNVDPEKAKVEIAAGPNNPVGDVWIDINKPHYGIHGTPEPGRIGHTESHGCVRMTNWDAVKLAGLVAKGTPVIFRSNEDAAFIISNLIRGTYSVLLQDQDEWISTWDRVCQSQATVSMSSHPCYPVDVRSHYLANMSKSKHPARAFCRYYGDYLFRTSGLDTRGSI